MIAALRPAPICHYHVPRSFNPLLGPLLWAIAHHVRAVGVKFFVLLWKNGSYISLWQCSLVPFVEVMRAVVVVVVVNSLAFISSKELIFKGLFVKSHLISSVSWWCAAYQNSTWGEHCQGQIEIGTHFIMRHYGKCCASEGAINIVKC